MLPSRGVLWLFAHPLELNPINFHANSKSHLEKVSASVDELNIRQVENKIQKLARMFGGDEEKAVSIRTSQLKKLRKAKFLYTWHWTKWKQFNLKNADLLNSESYGWLRNKFALNLGGLGILDENGYVVAMEKVQDCMKSALIACDTKGLFGTDYAREKVLISTANTNFIAKPLVESIEEMNPLKSLKYYFPKYWLRNLKIIF